MTLIDLLIDTVYPGYGFGGYGHGGYGGGYSESYGYHYGGGHGYGHGGFGHGFY